MGLVNTPIETYKLNGVNVDVKRDDLVGDGINYPKPGNTVTCHYTGYLTNGNRFDSSRDRGKPFKFKLGSEQVIPGLDLGVAQLSIGERAKLTIPSRLAYGEKGFPGLIGKNEDLVFDMELITFS